MKKFDNDYVNKERLHRHVALIIETSNEYARGLLRGIRMYIREHRTWSVYLCEHDRTSTNLSWLSNWNGDGILARIENSQISQYIEEKKLPAVDLSAGRYIPHLPCVETNDSSIAKFAFDHLYEKGYRNFAYCGNSQFFWSRNRQNCFSSLAKEKKHNCSIFDSEVSGNIENYSVLIKLVDWIKKLEKPCGVMACYDIQGQKILEACLLGNINVPEEIGVIGVDNDTLMCELTYPPLTSIRPNSEKTGYEASKILDSMMAGNYVPPQLYSIEPIDIVPRQSTDILYINNQILTDSLKFIQENAHLNIKVQDVQNHVHSSRQVLEQLFRKYLNRTPHQEIVRTKINRAKNLLLETDLPISIIADRSGFINSEYFSVAFKKSENTSPSHFREQIGVDAGID